MEVAVEGRPRQPGLPQEAGEAVYFQIWNCVSEWPLVSRELLFLPTHAPALLPKRVREPI